MLCSRVLWDGRAQEIFSLITPLPWEPEPQHGSDGLKRLRRVSDSGRHHRRFHVEALNFYFEHFSGALTWVLELGSILIFYLLNYCFAYKPSTCQTMWRELGFMHLDIWRMKEEGQLEPAAMVKVAPAFHWGSGPIRVQFLQKLSWQILISCTGNVHWLTPAHSWVESWNIVGKISSPRSYLRRDGYFFSSHCESVTFWVIATGSCDCGFLCTFWTSRVPLQVTLSRFHPLRAEEAKK